MQPQPHRMMANGIRVDNPDIIRVGHNTGVKCSPLITAVNMEDPRVNCPDGTDGSNLEDGVGDRVFDLNDYEGVGELSPSPSTTASRSHHRLRQPVLCTIMNSRSSDVTPVMRLGTSRMTVPSACRP